MPRHKDVVGEFTVSVIISFKNHCITITRWPCMAQGVYVAASSGADHDTNIKVDAKQAQSVYSAVTSVRKLADDSSVSLKHDQSDKATDTTVKQRTATQPGPAAEICSTKPIIMQSPTPSTCRVRLKVPLRLQAGSSDRVRAAFKSPARISSSGSTSFTTSAQKNVCSPQTSGSECPATCMLKSPFIPRSSKVGSASSETPQGVADDIVMLKKMLKSVEEEVEMLAKEYSEEELQLYIERLHEYNEMKDVGQLLLGKLAEIQHTTNAALYEKFGLDLDD